MKAPDSLLGQVLEGRYRVRRLIGRGGMGSVFEAEELETGRALAVKILSTEIGAGAGDIESRFEREAKAGSFLRHPNVVEVLALGRVPHGAPFLVMELARGRTVGQVLDAERRLAPRRALVIARQALEGLRHAHTSGLIHRDLKPDNIMLVPVGRPGDEYEQVKLLDFGIVKLVGFAAAELGADKLTRTGTVFGTPGYMAPEQALGRPVDGRADLYSLAVILFEMLCGRPPFSSDDMLNLLRMQVSQPPPALAEAAPGAAFATPELEALLARALRKRAEERFADAAAMTDALDQAFLSLDRTD